MNCSYIHKAPVKTILADLSLTTCLQEDKCTYCMHVENKDHIHT